MVPPMAWNGWCGAGIADFVVEGKGRRADTTTGRGVLIVMNGAWFSGVNPWGEEKDDGAVIGFQASDGDGVHLACLVPCAVVWDTW